MDKYQDGVDELCDLANSAHSSTKNTTKAGSSSTNPKSWKRALDKDLSAKREKFCEIVEIYKNRLNNSEAQNPALHQINIELKSILITLNDESNTEANYLKVQVLSEQICQESQPLILNTQTTSGQTIHMNEVLSFQTNQTEYIGIIVLIECSNK